MGASKAEIVGSLAEIVHDWRDGLREQLVALSSGRNYEAQDRAIDLQVSRLRNKLGDDGGPDPGGRSFGGRGRCGGGGGRRGRGLRRLRRRGRLRRLGFRRIRGNSLAAPVVQARRQHQRPQTDEHGFAG